MVKRRAVSCCKVLSLSMGEVSRHSGCGVVREPGVFESPVVAKYVEDCLKIVVNKDSERVLRLCIGTLWRECVL